MTEVAPTLGDGPTRHQGEPRPDLDPALPHLVRLLDTSEAFRLLCRHWPSGRPPPSAGARCSLHHVRWTPGTEAVASYVLEDPRPTGRALVTVGAVAIGPEGDTEVWWFEDDAALPGVAAARDPAMMGARLGELLGSSVEACTAEPVSYRPGERCVLRLDVRTRDRTVAVYAKALAGEGSSRLAATLEFLGTATEPPVAPALLAHVPEWGLVLVADAGARRVAFDRALSPGILRDLRRVGEVLAQLHGTAGAWGPHASARPRHLAPGDRAAPIDDELAIDELAIHDLAIDELRCLAPALTRAVPSTSQRFARAVDLLAADGPGTEPPDRRRLVPGHGAFRLDQVRFGADPSGRALLIDLDTFALAEPERDVANLFAYVRWSAMRQLAASERDDAAAAVRDAVAGGYADSGGAVLDGERLRAWEAASLLKIAGRRCRRLATHEWDRVPGLVDAALALLSSGGRRSSVRRSPAPIELDAWGDVLDRDAMSKRFTDALGPVLGARRVDVVGARLSGGKPGERAVVVYDVEVDGTGPRRLVGKLFADRRRARRLHDLLGRLQRAGFGRDGNEVPEPLGHLGELGMVVCSWLGGVSIDRLRADERPDAVMSAARWLVSLHRVDVPLHRTLDLARETSNLVRWGELVASTHPDSSGAVERLVGELAAAAPCLRVRTDVPIHKDFQYQHVLVQRGGIGVVDLDEMRAGDPSFDVAHFAMYLRLLELRAGGAEKSAPRLEPCFVRAYASMTGYVVDDLHAFARAYTCLKIAKQLVSGRGPTPVPAGRGLARQLGGVLAEGLRSLAP